MGLCTGQKIPYEDILPAELQRLRGRSADLVNANLGQPTAQYPGQLTAPQDPLSSMASSIMMGMMGQAGKTGLYGTPTGGLFPNMNIPKPVFPPGWMDYTKYPGGGDGGNDGGQGQFKCPTCGQGFNTKAELNDHINREHRE